MNTNISGDFQISISVPLKMSKRTITFKINLCKLLKKFSLLKQSTKSMNYSEVATGGVLQEKVFLEISQKSQENTCDRVSFFNNLQASLWHRCFPVNFTKFLRTPFLQNISRRLLLTIL